MFVLSGIVFCFWLSNREFEVAIVLKWAGNFIFGFKPQLQSHETLLRCYFLLMAHSIVTSVAKLSETRPLPSLDLYVEPQTVLNIGETFL